MNNYKEIIERDNTNSSDNERLAMFWIIANNSDLFNKINDIYNFETRQLKTHIIEDLTIPLSAKKLMNIAYNLFIGKPADILENLIGLEENNYKTALEAINIRFKGLYQKEAFINTSSTNTVMYTIDKVEDNNAIVKLGNKEILKLATSALPIQVVEGDNLKIAVDTSQTTFREDKLWTDNNNYFN